MIHYLLFEDIVLINKLTVEAHGGNFVPPKNLLHQENLEYLVGIVDSEMFGVPLYPTIHDKAALYMYNIISNHIFQDGNKRTGLEAALLFLKLNGHSLKENLITHQDDEQTIPKTGNNSNEILFNFTIEVASGELTLEQCASWFKANMTKLSA